MRAVKNTRVVIVTPYGAEERLDNYAEFLLARAFIKNGYRVKFCTYKISNSSNYHQDFVYKDVPVYRCRQLFGISLKLVLEIVSFRPQVVILFHPRSLLNLSAYVGARLSGAKVISEIVGILHDPFVCTDRDRPLETLNRDAKFIGGWKELFTKLLQKRRYQVWEDFLLHFHVFKADAVVAISLDEKKYIGQFYRRDAVVIPWALPEKAMEEMVKPVLPNHCDLPNNFLFFIGQIKKRKGWDTVIECLSILKERGIKKYLIFVSPDVNNTEAKNYAEKLGIIDQIIFLSGISNAERNWLYSNAQYVLAPSRYEGFGLPVFEAFRAGRPLLGTNIPVYLEFLEHGKNSMLSEIGDPAGLAENIIKLDNNPELVKNIIKAGYETASHYTEQIMVDKFLDLMSTLR